MFVEIKYNVDGTMLGGNKTRSFLHEGINHTAELSFFDSGALPESRRFETLAVGRYTNNPQVDPERNSLQRFYFRLSGQTFESTIGDALVNYSRMTFSQNIKGLNIRKDFASKWRWTGTAGFFVDRWGSLYRPFSVFRNVAVDCQASSTPAKPGVPAMPAPGCVESPPGSGNFVLSPGTPTKPYSRLVGGSRLERKFGRSSWIAGNWSHGTDLRQSLPEATVTCVDSTGALTLEPINMGCAAGTRELPNGRKPGVQSFDNDTVSADSSLSWEPWKLNFNGEFAYSWTVGGTPPANASPTNFVCASQPSTVGASVLDSRCFSDRVGDWAGQVQVAEKIHSLNWRVDYTRFEPNFFSANARQIQDLQDFGVRGDYQFSRQVILLASWRRTNDNLNGQRDFTGLVHAPEVRLTFQELPFYRRMVVEVGYRERSLRNVGHPQPSEVMADITRIPYMTLTLPVGRTRFGVEYEHRHEINAAMQPLSTDTDHIGVSFRGDYTFNQWEFSPSLRLEAERLDKTVPFNAALAQTDLTLVFPRDFFDAFDTNRTYQAGFALEAPRYLRIEADFREYNSLILSPLQASAQLDPQMRFFYLNQGFKRPSWHAAVIYKIGNDENKRIMAYYLRTNNFFATGDPFAPDLKSFRETVIGGTVVLRFRR